MERAGICSSTRNNLASALPSSHMLSPISLESFLPSLEGMFWLTQHAIHPSVILLLGSDSKMRMMTGWSTGEVERTQPFCLRHKTNRKDRMQTKPDKHQRCIRCTNSRKHQHFTETLPN